ncbi:MAG TPA: protein kinase, partial [Candidatus Omnitrophota bacterium]|nr:protein kinase [Candidatus Omnitrophota bacterium]
NLLSVAQVVLDAFPRDASSSPVVWARFNRGGDWTPFLGRMDTPILTGVLKHLRKKGFREIESFNTLLPSFRGRVLRFRVVNDMPLMQEFIGGRIGKDGALEVYFSSEDLVARFNWEFSRPEERITALQSLAAYESLLSLGKLKEENAPIHARVAQLVLDETAREKEEIRQAFLPLGYEMFEKISVGGNARVYKARKDDGRYVAIKLEKARARKKYDARVLQELINRIGRFRYVMTIEGYASAVLWGELRQFVVLEYVEGDDLKHIIESGEIDRWSFGKVLNTLFMLAQALAYFHARGLSHTDVALHNVMITPSGDVKLIDYDRPYSVKFKYKDVYCLQRVMTQVLMKSVQKRIKLNAQQLLSLWFRSPVNSEAERLGRQTAVIVQSAFKYPWRYIPASHLAEHLGHVLGEYRKLDMAATESPEHPREDGRASSSPVNALTARSMQLAKQRYSHSRYGEEPYIAQGFAMLENIFLRIAAYEYLHESGKIHGPPENVREQVESWIAGFPEVIPSLYPKVIARSDQWNRSRRIILRNILKKLQYPSYQIAWVIAHINLNQKADGLWEAASRQFRRFRVEYRAALSDFILSIADWNFRIYILSIKRVAAQDQSPYRDELSRMAAEIRQKLVFFKMARLGDDLLGRFGRVDDLLVGRNEPAVNMILTSALIAARHTKLNILQRRLRQERHTPPQRLRHDEDGLIRLRGQRYERAGSWNMSAVKEYGDLTYRSLWDALRAVDHMVDSELDDIRWIYNLTRLLNRLSTMNENPADIRTPVVGQLQGLAHVMVEEKILARIILEHSLELLDVSPPAFVKISGLFAVVNQFLSLRVMESRAIVLGLNKARVFRLRQEIEQSQNAQKGRAFKALKQLGYGYLRLPRMILEQDLLNPEHPAYLDPREPQTADLAYLFREHVRPLLSKTRLSGPELGQVKEAFTFMKNKVIVAITLNRFMEAYRNRFVESHLEEEGISRRSAFVQTFEEFLGNARYHVVQKHPALYWAIFYQAAFVNRYARPETGEEETVESNLFRCLSDHILQTQLRLSQAKYLPGWFSPQTCVLTGEDRKIFDAVVSGDRDRSFATEAFSSPVTDERKTVVVFLGLPCSGKTTLGRSVAERRGAPFVSMGELLRHVEQRVSSPVTMAEGYEPITFGPSQPLAAEDAEGRETITFGQAWSLQMTEDGEKIDQVNNIAAKRQFEYTDIASRVL